MPDAVRKGEPLAVVVNFHGGGSNANQEQRYCKMDSLADREGFVVVYPDGTGPGGRRHLTWNAGHCCAYAQANEMDDVGFTLAMLDELARLVPVDRRRVYATGLSNGAMMAYRLAQEAADRIAAIAPVAGVAQLEPFAPSRRVPILHIHSVDDERALYDGGLGPPYPWTDYRVRHFAVEDVVGRWAAHNGCGAAPTPRRVLRAKPRSKDTGHTATELVYSRCATGSEVVLWKLTGAGHVWPGGRRAFELALGPATAILDANGEMWRFFEEHALP